MYNFIRRIQGFHPDKRTLQNLSRRIHKLTEEMGETAEAYLYVTSINNRKNLTWDDLREEAIDAVVVGLDIALTRFPIDSGKTSEEIEQEVIEVIERKLAKWQKQIDDELDATQTEKTLDIDE